MSAHDLAAYSNLAMYAAMVVLTIAMVAFAVQAALVLAGRSGRRPHREGDAARVPVAAERSPASAALVGAGVGGAAGGLASGAGASVRSDGSAVAGPVVGRDAGPTAEGSSTGGASGGAALSGRGTSQRLQRVGASIGMSCTWIAAFLLVVSAGLRGAAVHRAPVGNMFEFAVAGAAAALLVFAVWSLARPVQGLGLLVTTPVLLVLGLAMTVWYTEAAELMPSLKSVWLAIHVPVAIASVGVFAVAFSTLMVQLWQESRERRDAAGEPPRGLRGRLDRLAEELPDAATLDRMSYSLHVIAFPLWTFTLVAGAIWAQQAWGTYWNWDPKETWTFVVWVLYAAYLHARATSGWSRRTANILAMVGFAAIIVNFAVVNVYFPGQHSYSGL